MKVFLQNIRSCHNVGAIFRTADAIGVDEIFLGGYTPLPNDKWGVVNRSLVKVSLGAEKNILWNRVYSLGKKIEQLKADGFILLALELDKLSIDYTDLVLTSRELDKVVVFLGNEKRGLSKSILSKMDYILKIPMHGAKESLNVSIAFSVAAFMLRDNPLKKFKN